MTEMNDPHLWIHALPIKEAASHKYDYGHALIYGAPEMTGATRLAATACSRMGAGLVSVLCTDETYDVYRASLPAQIITRNDLSYTHDKATARLYGCGGLPCKVDFQSDLPTVLDADALKNLPKKLSPHYILTPHEGEFAKAFQAIKGGKVEKAMQAAKTMNAVIVLKGQETVIASPDGQCVVNSHASPYLATGGTGDVLAGIITGLLAQKMEPFEAACAAVWIHGQASLNREEGLVASDLEYEIPKILKSLHDARNKKSMGFV